MITPKTYETLLLFDKQLFIVGGRDYIVIEQLRSSNGKEQEIYYKFSPYPNKKSEYFTMIHDRVDELERTNKIKYK